MRKALRITAITVTSLLLLVVLIMLWLTTNSGKNFLRLRAISFLEKKLNTDVKIGKLDYRLPEWVELFDVYFEDQHQDTLLSARHMRVNIDMLKLLANKVEVEEIQIDGAVANLYRIAPDTTFNFDYAVKAFSAPPNPRAQNAPTDSTGQLQLDIRRLLLNDVYVLYNDQTGGDRFMLDVDTLHANITKIDPYSQDYWLNTLYIDGMRSAFTMDTSYLVKKEKDTLKPLPNIAIREINLHDIDFNFENKNDELAFDINIGMLFTHPRTIDLNRQNITVNDFRMDSSSVALLMGRKSAAKAEELVEENPAPSQKWRFLANSLKLKGVDYKMDNNAMPRLSYGVDYAHLDVKNIMLDAEDVQYTTDTITGNIRHLSAADKSGLDIRDMRTVFMYHPEGVYLRNLYLQTSRSTLRDYAAISYPSLSALQERPQLLKLQADLTNSTLGITDLLLFAPQLKKLPFFDKYENETVRLTLVGEGQLDNLQIDRFQVQGFDNSYIDLSGTLQGIPDPNRLRYAFSIRRLDSRESVAEAWLPAATLKTIDLPTSFSVNGKLSGTASSVDMDLIATTSDGNATIKGPLEFGTRPGREKYDLYVKASKLNIGKIIKQEKTIGHITGTIYAKGQGFDINYMNAVVRGDIQSAAILGYTYNNVRIDGRIADKTAELSVDSKDPNANLTFDGDINFNNQYPSIVGRLVAENLDLHALKLAKDPLRIAGTIDADISSLNPDYPAGTITANRPVVVLNGERYVLDSLYVTSTPSADSGNYIVVNTGDIQAVIQGRTPLTKIGTIVESHINRHYATNRQDSIRAMSAAPASYDLSINAFVKDGPMIRALLPGLQSMDTARIVAGFTPNTMFVNAALPRVRYNDMQVFNGKARVTGDNTGLNYDVSVDRFLSGNMDLWYTTAIGNIADQTITSKVRIADQQKVQRFGVDFVYHQHHDRQELHINDGLMLNYKTWSVTQPNAIVFSKEGFFVQNFRVSSGGESISLHSTSPDYSAPLSVGINNFLISNITEIISPDTLLVNGLVNGNLTLKDMMTEPMVNGNLTVNNLSVRGDTIGDVDARLNSASANKVDARVAISGRGNDVVVTGFFYPQPVNGNNFDLAVKVNTLNVRTVEGFANNQIRNTVGNIRGDLKITGTVANPVVLGELRTDSLTTTIAAVGARFNMPSERIIFTPTGIEFENFRLVDSRGNAGLVDGKIFTQDLSNLGIAMRVDFDRMMVLNSTPQDHDLFYGQLLASANLRISGSMMAPDIRGEVTVHDSTQLTVVVPEKEVAFQEREGIVEFVDMSDTGMFVLATPEDTTEIMAFRPGSYMNVNLTIEKEAEFNVIVDQGTGDFLRMQGEAALNTVMNPDGTIGITGTYTINQGAYELNYSFIKRRFDIQPGSTITFAGDPLKAQIDIKAVYTANVPPYELVERQVTDPAQLVYYRQRLPFQVHLNLSGEAMKPVIGFDVQLPENRSYGLTGDITALVQAKLMQLRTSPADMNKQVFSVLLLNRFVSENPFESGTGIDAGYVARQSVTRLISEQLNRFAGELIEGIDLTLDLQATEDYTTGQRRSRTDLNVSASKRMLNDRLKLTLGSNFELGGENGNRNENTSLIPGNIAADYDLSRTGRYKVRIYRRIADEDMIRGNISETGASFILTADYTKFSNLFISRKKRMRQMEERAKQKQEQLPPPPNATVRK